MWLRFDGCVVAVSGAGLGFGRAIASAFVEAGARVFGCDIRTAEAEVARAGAYDLQVVDLTDRAQACRWIREIEDRAGGPINVLVNNAGGVAGQSGRHLEDVEDREWDAVLAVNLGAAFALSRAVVAGMKAQGSGCIINIASGAGLRASLTGIQAYCAAKHALVGLTRQLAHELGPFAIRTNAVAPGFVVTNDATRRQWDGYGPEGQRRLLDGIALRRLGRPEDVANAVLFLASDLASFINGEVLSVDGGR
jgi:3-oxoacyl-[acyl-carrier protein] reductase